MNEFNDLPCVGRGGLVVCSVGLCVTGLGVLVIGGWVRVGKVARGSLGGVCVYSMFLFQLTPQSYLLGLVGLVGF